jgi:hypothetical protein
MTRNIQTAYRLEEFSTRHESCNIVIPEEYSSRRKRTLDENNG